MTARPPTHRPAPLLYSVPTAAALLGLSPKTLWRLIAAREAPSVVVGSRTYVPRIPMESWLQQLPSVSTGEAITNLAARATIAGLRAERVEVE